MSLINDALKRAKQAQKRDASAPPASETPLQPVENNPAQRSSSWIVPAVAVVILGLAVWFFVKWWSGSREPAKIASVPSTLTNRTVGGQMLRALSSASNVVRSVTNLRADAEAAFGTNKVSTPAPASASTANAAAETNKAPGPSAEQIAAASPAFSPATNLTSSSSNSIAAAEAANNASATPVPSRTGATAPLQLQGIFYRLSRPSVLINNRTLFVGDEIEGARVIAITRYGVKLVQGGKTNELTLR